MAAAPRSALVCALCLPLLAAAQDAAPLPPRGGEPAVQQVVTEDDGVRIEELRVRGQTQRIVVKPKHAVEYEIVPPTGGRDPSQNRGNQQAGAAGQRVWNLLRF
jgi:hypothetical protein